MPEGEAAAEEDEAEVVGEGLLTGLTDGSGLADGPGLFADDSLLPEETPGDGASLGLGCFGCFDDEAEPALPEDEARFFPPEGFCLLLPLVEPFGLLRRDSPAGLELALRATLGVPGLRTAARLSEDLKTAASSRAFRAGVGPTLSRIVLALVRFATSLRSVLELALRDRVGIEKTISMRFSFWSMRAVVPGCK